MRKIDLIVIYCLVMREDWCFMEFDLDVCYCRWGFNGLGYYFYIWKDGWIVFICLVEKIGVYVKGYNVMSIGICYEGGLDVRGCFKDIWMEWQVYLMWVLVKMLLKQYFGSCVCGYWDLSLDLNVNGEIEFEEWIKQCLCFNVIEDKKLY